MNTQQFYDLLSQSYHHIFEDWDNTIVWQGEIIAKFLSLHGYKPNEALLDCSCGIGTQIIGLAQQGFSNLYGSDISSKSIARAKKEALLRNASIQFDPVDMRYLDLFYEKPFQTIISMDNAIPHILEEIDLLQVFEGMYNKLEENGLLCMSIRDYDALLIDKPTSTTPRTLNNGNRIIFQTWDWLSSSTYNVNHFILNRIEDMWKTNSYTTTYRAYKREEISKLLRTAKFKTVTWHLPKKSGYYQPIVTAIK